MEGTRGQMDEGMMPVSLLLMRPLQQWQHKQRDDDKDRVRFTTTILIKHGSKAA